MSDNSVNLRIVVEGAWDLYKSFSELYLRVILNVFNCLLMEKSRGSAFLLFSFIHSFFTNIAISKL